MHITGRDENRGVYSNSTLDSLITEANKIADRKERYAKFNEIQAFVHAEQLIMPVCYSAVLSPKKISKRACLDTTVHGFFLNPDMHIEN